MFPSSSSYYSDHPSSSSSSYGDHPSSSSFDGGGAAPSASASASAAFFAASPPSFPANYLLQRSISSHSLFLHTNHNHSHISHGHHPYFSSSSPPAHHHHHQYQYLAPPPPLPPPPPPPPPQQQQRRQLCSSSSPSSSSCDFLDFNPAPVRRVYSTGDLQGMNGLQASAAESYNINGPDGGGGIGGRVGRYSAEERKERIEKYRSKRNQRNFHKKITYACRKTLADSRPRVRGRFARNGEPDTETEAEIETEAAENGYYENFDYNIYNNYDHTQNSGGGGGQKTLADSWPRAGGRFARNAEAEMEVETEAAESGYCENFGRNAYNNFDQTQNGGGGSCGDGSDINTQWWPQASALTDEEEDRCYVHDELWMEFGDVFSVNFLS